MFLRDMQCAHCGTVRIDMMLDGSETMIVEYCNACACTQRFVAICNGGSKTRVRIFDWPDDPEFYRGQYQAQSLTCKDSEGVDVKRFHSDTGTIGAAMHDKPRYHNGTDEREERREVKKYATRRTRGRLPLTFDQRST